MRRAAAKHFSGLLVGDRGKASLGRVTFWIVFGLCVYFWLARPVEAFPNSLDEALYVVLAYNLGSKFMWGRGRENDPDR